MRINRKLAIQILKYREEHKDFYFPFRVMCKECAEDGEEFMDIEPNEWKIIIENKNYKTFELWENLQNLDYETDELLAKGFIEKITSKSIETHITELAKKYRKEWKEELWESEDIEEFGLNEFIGGKAEAYEDCLCIIKKHQNISDYEKQ